MGKKMNDPAGKEAQVERQFMHTAGAKTGSEGRPDPRTHFPHHEMLGPRMLKVTVATSVVIVALFVSAGPIGSHALTGLQRSVYFAVVTAFSFPLHYSLMTLALYYTRFQPPLASTVAVAATAAVVSVPTTATSYLYPMLFFPGYQLPGFATLYVTVAVTAVSASVLFNYVIFQRIGDIRGAGAGPTRSRFRGSQGVTIGIADRSGESAPNRSEDEPPAIPAPPALEPPANPAGTPVRPFFDRLPAEMGYEIIYVKTEGHYLRVYTKAGTSRLLLRFADAVAELSNLGMQVHRSYWVALDQVVGLVKRDNRMMLRLTGNYEVPVSRTYVRAVRAAMPH